MHATGPRQPNSNSPEACCEACRSAGMPLTAHQPCKRRDITAGCAAGTPCALSPRHAAPAPSLRRPPPMPLRPRSAHQCAAASAPVPVAVLASTSRQRRWFSSTPDSAGLAAGAARASTRNSGSATCARKPTCVVDTPGCSRSMRKETGSSRSFSRSPCAKNSSSSCLTEPRCASQPMVMWHRSAHLMATCRSSVASRAVAGANGAPSAPGSARTPLLESPVVLVAAPTASVNDPSSMPLLAMSVPSTKSMTRRLIWR
mmetsp:Transcript_82363/g.233566  ORF Transcript_82363/g.233566 Transcript_82363/m.233566 type:complete len:258 (-) Transcript_82363:1698-2471(-)